MYPHHNRKPSHLKELYTTVHMTIWHSANVDLAWLGTTTEIDNVYGSHHMIFSTTLVVSLPAPS